MKRLVPAMLVCFVWAWSLGSGPFCSSLSAAKVASPAAKRSAPLVSESFDDARLLQRGWYDGEKFTISAQQALAGKGCIEYGWKAKTTTPATSAGIRHLFEPTDVVYLRW